MVKRFYVHNLFGYCDNEIVFNNKDRLTIVIGPNGCGKTTMLKMLDTIFSNRHFQLFRYEYEHIQIELDDNTSLQIEKRLSTAPPQKNDDRFIERSSAYELAYSVNGEQVCLLQDMNYPTLAMFARHLPYYRRNNPVSITNMQTGKRYTASDIEELIELHYDELPENVLEELAVVPLEIKHLLSDTTIRFISTERLRSSITEEEPYGGRFDRQRNTVEVYSDELRSKIKNTLSDYANMSQKLDENFPREVIAALHKKKRVNRKKIEDKLEEIQKLRQRHVLSGILDETDSPDYLKDNVGLKDVDASTATILTVYYEDTEKKLHSLDSLSSRISLFMEMINDKLGTSLKYLRVTNQNGFEVFGNKEKSIALKLLSSGEQQELVMLFDLVFNTKKNELVLIDEPELSLHVAWQRKFLNDIESIIQQNEINVLVATHSPQIINQRLELVNNLGEVD